MDESFSQKDDVRRRVRRQSDVKKVETGDSDNEFPDLADVGASDDDAESESDTDHDQSPQPTALKVSIGAILRVVTQCCTQNVKKGKRTPIKVRDQVAVKRSETKGKRRAETVNR